MVEAVLLVGGRGTRLRPLTVRTAKPMLPVGGVPFLAHQLARLVEAGIEHAVLATSYRAETFVDYFGDGSKAGLRIDYVTEEEPLGTGGAIRNVTPLLDGAPGDSVVVLNGDILSGHDLAGQIRFHEERNAAVTLHLVQVADARAFGCVPTDAQGRVTAFLEKMPEPVSDQVNAGCYVFRRGVLDGIPGGRVVSVERETFPGLVAEGQLVLGWVESGYWLDLGTPEALVQASSDLVRGEIRSSAFPAAGSESAVLAGATVAADAVLRGGALVAERASVGPRAVVDASIVNPGAVVGAGAVVRRSVIGEDAVIGDGCSLDSVVVGPGARLGASNELRAGARVWCDAAIPDAAIRFSSDE